MQVSIEIKGLKSLEKTLAKLGEGAKEGAYKSLVDSLLLIEETAVNSIQAHGSSSGRETRYNPKRTVTVSAPGKPPNSDLGKLVQSIGWNINKTNLFGVVGTGLKYGKYLELGTKAFRARPWLAPAARKAKEKIKGFFKANLKFKKG